MRLVRILAAILLSLSVVNCSLDIAVEDLAGPDFLKSKVLSETIGVADGITDLVITVELRNSDDTLVADHTPTMTIISGNGVSVFACTQSDASGISVCRLRSVIPGQVLVSIENIKIELTEEVVFNPSSRNGTFLQIVASAQNNQETTDAGNGKYSVTSHIGPSVSGLRQEVSGYEVFINTTGSITPTSDP